MKFTVALLVVAALALATPAMAAEKLSGDQYEFLYSRYMAQHNKHYDAEEFFERFENFKASVDYVQFHNEQSESSFTLSLNHMADWHEHEVRAMNGYQANNDGSIRRGYQTKILDVTALPTSVDWTTKSNIVTPVKNQGQCGSCWTFSATEAVESRYAIKYGKLYDLSEQELVACDQTNSDAGCNGGEMSDAFEYIHQHGQCTESSFPYISGTGATNGTCQIKTCNPVVFVKDYKFVQQFSDEALMAAVAEGPVSIAVNAGTNDWQMYEGGVMTNSCAGEAEDLDHGVVVVGYGTDSESGLDYWKVRNSWSASWGEEGYIRLGRGSQYGQNGQCGILRAGVYPIV